jgi:transposase
LATSVSGIGTISAAYIIVYTNCFKDFKTWRKFSCFIGAAPFDHSSGSSIRGRTRISNYAHKTIKTILTNAAKSAINHNPEIKLYYQRKLNEGKHKKIIINNVRNKLISRVFAVVNRGTPCVDLAKFAA